jgi:hypothetical protein
MALRSPEEFDRQGVVPRIVVWLCVKEMSASNQDIKYSSITGPSMKWAGVMIVCTP